MHPSSSSRQQEEASEHAHQGPADKGMQGRGMSSRADVRTEERPRGTGSVWAGSRESSLALRKRCGVMQRDGLLTHLFSAHSSWNSPARAPQKGHSRSREGHGVQKLEWGVVSSGAKY